MTTFHTHSALAPDLSTADETKAFHGMLKMCNLLPHQNKALVLKTFNEQGGDEA